MRLWTSLTVLGLAFGPACKGKNETSSPLAAPPPSAVAVPTRAEPAVIPGAKALPAEPPLGAGRPPLAWMAPAPLPGIEATAFAGDGTLLVAGGCEGSGAIGGKVLACEKKSAYVARLDARGAAAWARTIAGYWTTELAFSVDAATAESVVASADPSPGATDETYIARLAADGTSRWTTKLTKRARFHRVAMSARGEVAVTEWVESRKKDERVSVTLLDPDGRVRWTSPVPTPDGFAATQVPDVAIDAAGNVAVVHILTGTSGAISSKGAMSGFGADGKLRWTVVLDETARHVARDPAGGWMASEGVPYPCVWRVTAEGKRSSKACQETSEYLSYVAPDATGGLVAFGAFERPMTLAGKTYQAQGKDDLFLARLDRKLAPQWVAHFPGPGSELARAVAISGAGRIAIAGIVDRTLAIDGRTLKNETKTDFGPFVAVLGP